MVFGDGAEPVVGQADGLGEQRTRLVGALAFAELQVERHVEVCRVRRTGLVAVPLTRRGRDERLRRGAARRVTRVSTSIDEQPAIAASSSSTPPTTRASALASTPRGPWLLPRPTARC